jgi:hypothetical protein
MIKNCKKCNKEIVKKPTTSIINSLDNLQPLWRIDNIKKGNKYQQLTTT